MFYDIGKKIQTVARVITYIGIALSIIAGLILFGFACNNPEKLKGLFFLAPVAVVVGGLSAWLSSICLYGFGKLIEDTEEIRNNMEGCSENDSSLQRGFRSEPAPHTYSTRSVDRDSQLIAQENASTYAPTNPTYSLEEAVIFLERKYNVQLDLSDDIVALKEKKWQNKENIPELPRVQSSQSPWMNMDIYSHKPLILKRLCLVH